MALNGILLYDNGVRPSSAVLVLILVAATHLLCIIVLYRIFRCLFESIPFPRCTQSTINTAQRSGKDLFFIEMRVLVQRNTCGRSVRALSMKRPEDWKEGGESGNRRRASAGVKTGGGGGGD